MPRPFGNIEQEPEVTNATSWHALTQNQDTQ